MDKAMLIDTPLGRMLAVDSGQGLRALDFVDGPPDDAGLVMADTPLLLQCREQLEAYFAGRLQQFTLPLYILGTPFRQKVWQALRDIPYGQTRSYGDIARSIGQPKAVRAVGGANHHNPLSIIIPCHRVIGAGGSLVGYGGGLQRKQALLQLEREAR